MTMLALPSPISLTHHALHDSLAECLAGCSGDVTRIFQLTYLSRVVEVHDAINTLYVRWPAGIGNGRGYHTSVLMRTVMALPGSQDLGLMSASATALDTPSGATGKNR